MKNIINLCFICDQNYVKPTMVAIHSLKLNKNKNSKYNIYILVHDVSLEDQKALEKQSTKDIKVQIIKQDTLNIDENKINVERHVTTAALIKFYLPEIFYKLDKILYLDSDIIIQKDLVSLWNYNIKHQYAAVVKDTMTICGKNAHLKKLDFKEIAYFNSGVMLLNLSLMRKDHITEKLIDYRLNRYNKFMDQDAFNVIFSNKVTYIPLKYNMLNVYFDVLSIKDLSKLYEEKLKNKVIENFQDAVILHLGGKEKPWIYNMKHLTDLYKYYAGQISWKIVNKIKISVLVPIYNVEKYLRECLNSILNQTLKDIEIILLDDGSTDSSGRICDEYAAKDDRIKVIHKSNSGYGATMNIGLDLAQGEYIGIVESDDWIEKEMFETMYNKCKSEKIDFIKENYQTYCDDISKCKIVSAFDKNDVYNKIIRPLDVKKTFKGAPSIWSAIYNNDFLKSNNINFTETPGASFQDTAFWIKVLLRAQKAMFIKDAHLHYRIDNINSSVKDNKKIFCICDEFAELDKFTKNDDSFIKKIVLSLKLDKYIWNALRLEENAQKQFLAKESKVISDIIETKNYDSEIISISAIEQQIKRTQMKIFISNPKVSIIIPIYNADKYLRQCLDSIINQTLKDIEIICIDDGSTDQSLQILREYEKRDKRIRIITQKNEKQGAARNRGLEIAKGEYIQFVDADDYIENNTALELYHKCRDNNLELLCFGGCNFDDKTKNKIFSSSYERTHIADNLCNKVIKVSENNWVVQLAVSAALTIYNRKFLLKHDIKFPEKLYFEDNIFFVQSIMRAQNVMIVKDKYYHRRVHAISTTQNWQKYFEDYVAIIDLLLTWLKKENILNNIYASYKNSYLNSAINIYNNLRPSYKQKYHTLLENLVNKYAKEKIGEIRNSSVFKSYIFFIKNFYDRSNMINKLLLLQQVSARIDIKNFGNDKNRVGITTSAKVSQPTWFTNTQGIGQVVEVNKKIQNISIKAIQDGKLRLDFKGQDKRFEGTRFPVWVDYKSIKIDGKEILSAPIATWHDKPFRYEMPVKDGQVVKVEVVQQYHQYDKDELKDVILKLNPNSDYIRQNIKRLTDKIYNKITVNPSAPRAKKPKAASNQELLASIAALNARIERLEQENRDRQAQLLAAINTLKKS